MKNEKAWLLKVTHNKVVSWLRKNGNGQVLVPWDEVGDYGTLVDLQTPDSRIISREEISRINQVVNQLPPRCRQVFVLAKIEKLPYKEIAEVLGISVKTINILIEHHVFQKDADGNLAPRLDFGKSRALFA